MVGKEITDSKLTGIVFEEVTELEAGKPYVFLASESEINIPMIGDAVATPDSENGLMGAFEVTKVSRSVYNYILSNNLLYCAKNTQYYVGENRAYFKIDEMSEVGAAAPAPGKRRARMSVADTETATGVFEIEDATITRKIIVDGRVMIERDGKRYDVLGNKY